jgi:ATP-binding cassette subfamily B protein
MFSKSPIINLFSHLWEYSKGNRSRVVLFIVLETLASVIMLGTPLVVSFAFNNVQFASDDPKFLTNLILNLSLMVGILVLFWLLHGISRVIENKNAFLVRKAYKEDMINKALQLPLEWHKKHHSGDTIDKINKSAGALYSFSESTFLINTSLVRVFGSLIAIFLFDHSAGLIAIFVTILGIYSMLKFDNILKNYYSNIYKSENHLASAIHDYITNIFSIITLRLKGRVTREISERGFRAYPDFKKSVTLVEVKWFTIGFFTTAMTFIVLSLNAYTSYKTNGVIVIGTLFALFTYLHNIGGVFNTFAFHYGKIVQNNTAVIETYIINEEYKKIEHPENLSLPLEWKMLDINNLSFTYENEDEKENTTRHLENLNLKIKRNEKIALIGESGSGKSTVLALLRGLYIADTGELYIDGNLQPKGLFPLYNHVTLIPQEPELFNSTVLDNITMDTEVGKEEVMKMIKLAQFESVLLRLPKGLMTNVMEKGVSLSGGEKQRLALARGLLAGQGSDFVFLDEPTSSVDFTNEMKIYENVLKEFKDKTVLSTVHNLSLLKYFDKIYLFSKGKLISGGTFDEILKNKKFQNLWDDYNKTLV